MTPEIKNNSDKGLVWFSRLLRWGLGIIFIGAGITYFNDGAWPALFFGAVLIVTGFFRPRRCIDDQCEINS
jgi:hypothetical protein